jgi:hypothetical protein
MLFTICFLMVCIVSIEENPHKLLKLLLKFQEKQPIGVTNNKSKRGREGGRERGEKKWQLQLTVRDVMLRAWRERVGE